MAKTTKAKKATKKTAELRCDQVDLIDMRETHDAGESGLELRVRDSLKDGTGSERMIFFYFTADQAEELHNAIDWAVQGATETADETDE